MVDYDYIHQLYCRRGSFYPQRGYLVHLGLA